MVWLLRSVSVVVLLAGVSGPVAGQALEWPQFRGPAGLATAPGQRLPDEFGPERNVVWKQEVPAGHSSPIVWGDRVFLTGSEGSTLSVLAYNRSDGAPLWKRDFAVAGEEQLQHRDAIPAAPTPCTDGKRVHAYFGGYGLVTLDMEGELVWEHRFPVEKSAFGTGSSPILDDGALYLVRDIDGLSSVHAFDAATGEKLWTTPRPEAGLSYSTPFIWKHEDRTDRRDAPGTRLPSSTTTGVGRGTSTRSSRLESVRPPVETSSSRSEPAAKATSRTPTSCGRRQRACRTWPRRCSTVAACTT